MSKLTRALRVEVEFPSIRSADRSALYKRLWGVSDDVTRAATRIIGALFLVKQGMLTLPVDEVPRRKLKPGQEWRPKAWPLASAAYRGFSGEWQPFTDQGPLYAPYGDHVRASGNVLTATAGQIVSRLQTDYVDAIRGKKQIANFNTLPIYNTNQGVDLGANGTIRLNVSEGGGWVTVRPRKLDGSKNAILHALRSGEYKLGSTALAWDDRRKKWFLSIAWTNENHAVRVVPEIPERIVFETAPVIAGIDVGIQHAVWTAYVNLDGTPARERPTVIQFPQRTFRATGRVESEIKQRSAFNRLDLNQRSGQGRDRKLRAMANIRDKRQRLTDTMLQQIAAATVNDLKRRNVVLVGVEEHASFAENVHVRASHARTLAEGARVRRDWMRMHAGGMRDALVSACEVAGIKVVAVEAAWTSQTCHRCGITWKMHGLAARAHGDGTESAEVLAAGRFEHRRFRCAAGLKGKVFASDGAVVAEKNGCGYEGQADHNAAINIARLALRVHDGEVGARIAPVRGKKSTKKVDAAAK